MRKTKTVPHTVRIRHKSQDVTVVVPADNWQKSRRYPDSQEYCFASISLPDGTRFQVLGVRQVKRA